MKQINKNRADLLLLFSKGPARSLQDYTYPSVEYYTSDDDVLLGVILYDRIDDCYAYVLNDRNSLMQYECVYSDYDFQTIEEARANLKKYMDVYVRDTDSLLRQGVAVDFFTQITNDKELNPNFKLLCDSDSYSSAKETIQEISRYYVDKDGNFVEQLQTKNGFDARIWELYLLCYLREEGFVVDQDHDVPDFFVDKLGQKVAIEAVTCNRRELTYGNPMPDYTLDEMFTKLDNEIPLMFGSSLFTKVQHECNKKKYWELDHVKDIPLLFAIEDFHEDASMMWTFNGVISILYGIDQNIMNDESGRVVLNTINGKIFVKDGKNGKVEITPLFFSKEFVNVSAVLFSTTGTLSKFNRMGRQAGFGKKNSTMLQTKCTYNHNTNAILPNFSARVIDESCKETWGDGVAIFHNPFAKNPLDPSLFPTASHHFYKDGQLYSDVPKDHTISSFTWNIAGVHDIPAFTLRSKNKFDEVTKQWNMK